MKMQRKREDNFEAIDVERKRTKKAQAARKKAEKERGKGRSV